MFDCTSEELINDPQPITQSQAVGEYQKHYQNRNDLIRDHGDHASYMTDKILISLGY